PRSLKQRNQPHTGPTPVPDSNQLPLHSLDFRLQENSIVSRAPQRRGNGARLHLKQLIVAKLEWRFDFALNFQAPVRRRDLWNREMATNVKGFVRRGKAAERRERHLEVERFLFANDQTACRERIVNHG